MTTDHAITARTTAHVIRLETEVERLRAALAQISNLDFTEWMYGAEDYDHLWHKAKLIAKEALA